MKTILLITAMIVSTGIYSQLQIVDEEKDKEELGEVSKLGSTKLLSYKVGDMVTFEYKDMNYYQIDEFKSFSITEQSFKELYVLILENWKDPPKEPITIKLKGQGYYMIDYTRMLGTTNFRFKHSIDDNGNVIGKSAYMNRKEVNKLFGVGN